MQTTQTVWVRSRNIIRRAQVRDLPLQVAVKLHPIADPVTREVLMKATGTTGLLAFPHPTHMDMIQCHRASRWQSDYVTLLRGFVRQIAPPPGATPSRRDGRQSPQASRETWQGTTAVGKATTRSTGVRPAP